MTSFVIEGHDNLRIIHAPTEWFTIIIVHNPLPPKCFIAIFREIHEGYFTKSNIHFCHEKFPDGLQNSTTNWLTKIKGQSFELMQWITHCSKKCELQQILLITSHKIHMHAIWNLSFSFQFCWYGNSEVIDDFFSACKQPLRRPNALITIFPAKYVHARFGRTSTAAVRKCAALVRRGFVVMQQ